MRPLYERLQKMTITPVATIVGLDNSSGADHSNQLERVKHRATALLHEWGQIQNMDWGVNSSSKEKEVFMPKTPTIVEVQAKKVDQTKPLEKDYPNKIAYLKDKIRWEQAQKTMSL